MIARGFKSVLWVATVGGAALGCYMVSLKVATERAELAKVEQQIIAAKRDIRTLQTELGTRGRLSQLEQWNAEVLALSAPSSAQFIDSEVRLARFEQTDPTLDERSAEVRMAAAEVPQPAPAAAAPALPVVRAAAPAAAPPPPLVRKASFTAAEPKPAEKPKLPAPKDESAASKPRLLAAAMAEPEVEEKAPGPKPQAKADKPRASRIDAKLAEEIKAQGSGGN